MAARFRNVEIINVVINRESINVIETNERNDIQ